MMNFVKYNLIGVLNTAIGYFIIFGSMYKFGFNPQLSNLIGYSLGLISSYALNKKFNFKTKTSIKQEAPLFIAVFLLCYFCNLFVLEMAITVFNINPYLGQVISGIIYVVISFFLCKFVVFRRDIIMTDNLERSATALERVAVLNNWVANIRWEKYLSAVSSLIATVLVCIALGFTKRDMAVPLNYGGDTLWMLVEAKSILQNGWTWFIPQLSAPFGLTSLAFPMNTTSDWVIMRFLSGVLDEPGLLLNSFWILSVAVTAYLCCYALRTVGVVPVLSLSLAVTYALLPFAFMRNTIHVNLVYYLAPALALGSLYLAMGAPAGMDRAYRWLVIPASVMQGFNYVYFSVFAVFFFIIGAIIGGRDGVQSKVYRRAALVVIAVVGATVLNLAPSIYVWEKDGLPPNMEYKLPMEAELYGLKIRHMLVPSLYNELEPLRRWAHADHTANFPGDNENRTARLGLVGSIGFIALIGMLCFGTPRADSEGAVGLKEAAAASARLTLAGLLLATVGGFGAILNLIKADIRCYNRISVFLAFFALLGFAYLVQLLFERTKSKRVSVAATVLVGVIVTLSLYDQLRDAKPLRDRYKYDKSSFDIDKAFVSEIEQKLSAHSKIFQLPYTSFPPDGGRVRMLPYDHARPYIWSNSLYWSWPSFSLIHDAWISMVLATPGKDIPSVLKSAGFSAIWIDRFGYEDNGEATISELIQGGAKPLSESSDRRYIVLEIGNHVSASGDLIRDIPPVLARGFYGWEGDRGKHTWTKGDAEMWLVNWSSQPRDGSLSMDLGTLAPRTVTIKVDDSRPMSFALVKNGTQHVELQFKLQPGRTRLSFHTDSPAVQPSNGDPRFLAFSLSSVHYRMNDPSP